MIIFVLVSRCAPLAASHPEFVSCPPLAAWPCVSLQVLFLTRVFQLSCPPRTACKACFLSAPLAASPGVQGSVARTLQLDLRFFSAQFPAPWFPSRTTIAAFLALFPSPAVFTLQFAVRVSSVQLSPLCRLPSRGSSAARPLAAYVSSAAGPLRLATHCFLSCPPIVVFPLLCAPCSLPCVLPKLRCPPLAACISCFLSHVHHAASCPPVLPQLSCGPLAAWPCASTCPSQFPVRVSSAARPCSLHGVFL